MVLTYLKCYLDQFINTNCVHNKKELVPWLVRDHLRFRDFGHYRIIFINVHVVTTAATAMSLRNFGLCVFYLHVGSLIIICL